MLLDPSKRQAYLHQNWPEQWHQKAIDAAQQIWEDDYKNLPLSRSSGDPMDVDPVEPATDAPKNALDRLKRRLKLRQHLSLMAMI
jgi:hypothetical protein